MKTASGGRGFALALICLLLLGLPVLSAGRGRKLTLAISDQRTGEIFLQVPVQKGDELSYGWEHSFEHVAWTEYFTVQSDGSLNLTRIAVGGFGAGIPAEMDCTYRYEDGLIYMENIHGSVFPEICWIHSQTQMQWIALDGKNIIRGSQLPQRARMRLRISK